MKLAIQKVGEELAITLPADLVARLQWGSGDLLEAEVIAGGLTLTRIEAAHDQVMRIAEDVMDEYRTTFEQLAKM